MEKTYKFVIYGDSCSGVPNTNHANTLSKINTLIEEKAEEIDFVIFPGDEIIGLTNNEKKLRDQWDYWLNEEMKYISKYKIPLYNCSGNHTVYNKISLSIFQEKLSHLPQNGPTNLKGVSYYVKYQDLLMVFIDTMGNNIGGEGRVETEWLNGILSKDNSKYKFVIGHHPIFPTNGFSGDFQRTVEIENGKKFWNVLKENKVFGYVCSHLLAYDVQVHNGVLQIMTAGAGTQYRMPPETEYHHYLNCVINKDGLAYSVIDESGATREKLAWPIEIQDNKWTYLQPINSTLKELDNWNKLPSKDILLLRINLHPIKTNQLSRTILYGFEQVDEMPLIWIGLTGKENKLTIYLSRDIGRSPMHWYGPNLSENKEVNFDIAFHNNMGPGGLLWKWKDSSKWTSLTSSTAMGIDKVKWPTKWHIQHNGDNNTTGFCNNIKIYSQY